MDETATSGPDGPPEGQPSGQGASPAPRPDTERNPAGRSDAGPSDGEPGQARRRRGSRGGRGRARPAGSATAGGDDESSVTASDHDAGTPAPARVPVKPSQPVAADPVRSGPSRNPEELPEPMREGRVQDPAVAERVLVRRPQIGDRIPPSMVPAPATPATPAAAPSGGGRQNGGNTGGGAGGGAAKSRNRNRSGRRRSRGRGPSQSGESVSPVESITTTPVDLDERDLERRRGRERKGRPVGRYTMLVSVRANATQIAVLEGRNLIEHYVSRPADDVHQIHGNIYLGQVQNVLPGMEAAFVDIGTPKNAVLYRGDVQYDAEDIEAKGANPRIEQILRPKQAILCQVTKIPSPTRGPGSPRKCRFPGVSWS